MNPPSRVSLLRALLRDAAAATFVPIVLAYFTGNPLPVHLPNTDMATVWWNTIQADPAEALHPLLTGFIYLMWIAWAWHTVCTALGLTWLAFRLPALALPTLVRRLTPAATVQALAIGSMLTAQATPAMAATTAHQQTVLPPAHRLPAQHDHRTAHPQTAETYTVRAGDSLWKIATDTYGHGQDWPAIYEANADRTEPDGAHLGDPNYLLPGWTVSIPDRVDTSPTTPPATHPAPPEPVSKAGDQHAASARAAVPHTVGFDIPGGGATGITLATTVGATCALIRRRHRLQNTKNTPRFAPIVEHLADAASDAQAAEKIGYQPDEHHGTPPMLNCPNPIPPTLGLSPDQRGEVSASAGNEGSVLSYTGAGAEDAARALAIETLAATAQAGGEDRVHLIIDQAVAYNLLGLSTADSLPGRLTVLDEELSAASLPAGRGRCIAIASATQASMAALQSAGARSGFTGILLGPASGTDSITALDIAHDGRIRTATGPRAHMLANVRFHTLPYSSARSLLALLYEAAAPDRPTPPATREHDNNDQGEPEEPNNHAPPVPPNLAEAAPVRPAPESTHPTKLLLRVLGSVAVEGPAATVPIDSDRSAAILALLALNPAGRSAEAMGEEIWKNNLPNHRPLAPVYNALQRTRSLLHGALGTKPEPTNEPLTSDHGRYRLAPSSVTTDLALQHELEAQANRAATPADRYRLLAQAARLHRGELAESLGADTFEDLAIARLEADSRAQRLHLAAAEAAIELDEDRAPDALDHLHRAMDIEPADRATAVTAHRLYQQLERPDLARAARKRHERACHALGIDPAPSTSPTGTNSPSRRPAPESHQGVAEGSATGGPRTLSRVAEAR